MVAHVVTPWLAIAVVCGCLVAAAPVLGVLAIAAALGSVGVSARRRGEGGAR